MDSILTPLLAYFIIVDPIGVSLIFNGLTLGKSRAYCTTMALRSTVISTLVILAFGFWGNALLQRLGIELDSFRVAGGLLIFHTAFGMITKADDTSMVTLGEGGDDISVFPLSIPMIAGPGVLTLTVLLFSEAAEGGRSTVPLVIAVVVTYLLTLTCFMLSKQIISCIGQTINNIFKRLLGVLLASLAIQFIADGVVGLTR